MNDKAASAPVEHLGDLLRVVGRRWLFIVLLTAAAVASAVAVSATREDRYEATAKLVLNQGQGATALVTGQTPSGSLDVERDVNTHVDLVTEDAVVDVVRRRKLALREDADALRDRTAVTVSGNSNILDITVGDGDPARAAAIANAFADEYVLFEQRTVRNGIEQAATLMRQRYSRLSRRDRTSPEGRQLRARARDLEIAARLQPSDVSVVRRAVVPDGPSSPKPVLAGVIAGVLGLLLAVAAALALHFTDRRLRDPQEVETLFGVPLLAAVPAPARRRDGRRPGDDRAQREAYTTLAANLRFFEGRRGDDAILVTSPGPQEGKSSVTLGLARALALMGQRVAVIEADLRRPSFAEVLGLSSYAPRREWVDVDAATLDAVYGTGREGAVTFAVLPATVDANPQAVLAGREMIDVISAAKAACDVVLIDVAPVGAVSDAIVLSHLVESSVVVTRAGRTRRDAAVRAADLLHNVGTQVAGVVVTGLPRRSVRGYPAARPRRHSTARSA